MNAYCANTNHTFTVFFSFTVSARQTLNTSQYSWHHWINVTKGNFFYFPYRNQYEIIEENEQALSFDCFTCCFSDSL